MKNYIIALIAFFAFVNIPHAFAEDFIIYTNQADGLKIYKKSATDTNNGSAINSVASYNPVYSPDGEYIVYRNGVDGYLYKKSATDTNNGSAITTQSGIEPVYSPDGQYIVYRSPSTNYIYKKSANDTSNGSAITSQNSFEVAYSPDGQYLVYRGPGNSLYQKSANDTSNGSQITVGIVALYPTYSPDGQYIVYKNSSSSDRLFKKSATDNSTGTAITSGAGDEPKYSPDGQYIVYSNSTIWRKSATDTNNGSAITTDVGYTPEYSPAPLVPPPEPLTEYINGLECVTDNIASLSGATWITDFGSLAVTYDASVLQPGTYGLYMTSEGLENRDIVITQKFGTGTFYSSGSIKYPGTATGYIRDTISDFAQTLVQSERNGAPIPWNIFQLYGVENIGFGYAGLIGGEIVGKQYIIPDTPITASGGVATFALKNTSLSIGSLIFQYVPTFKGMRLGHGTLEEKKACSIGTNICEWSYEGNSLDCVSRIPAGGVAFDGCGITGSGSIYGSGACVPLADGSGAILPTPPVLGGFATYDASGAVIGTVEPKITGENAMARVFTCGTSEEDDWWVYLGKILYCPITVASNIGKEIWNGVVGAQSRINQIEQITTGTLSGVTAGTGAESYTGSNALLQKMALIDAEIVEKPKVKMAYWLLVFLVFAVMLGIIISLAKK